MVVIDQYPLERPTMVTAAEVRRFHDRRDAGRALAHELRQWADPDVVVLGLPRGGVPVAAEVATALGAPLDVIVVRKLGAPHHPELAIGAVGEGGIRVLNMDVLAHYRVDEGLLREITDREQHEVETKARRYRDDVPLIGLTGRTALIVDDGIATGATARAACQVARAHGAGRVVVAVPVAPRGWEDDFADVADACVAVSAPADFVAVGLHYDDFTATSDDEVRACLSHRLPEEQQLAIEVDGSSLLGTLTTPAESTGLVVFAHGSGSSHRSVRNRHVARRLVARGLTTALFDLLTEVEENDRDNVFDIELLGRRLLAITDALHRDPTLAGQALGFFGASTGAAAALTAAAERGEEVSAVVCRGGRPDLAGAALPKVTAPTLLVVGGSDDVVLDLNRRALDALTCTADLTVVPGATHLFAEPGALDVVAGVAGDWFGRFLRRH